MDCKALNRLLVETVMTEWVTDSDGSSYCKFCNCYQFNHPLGESHFTNCPRPDWAMENADYPQARVERAYGKEFAWNVAQMEIREGSQGLTDLGRWMVQVFEDMK